MACLNPNQWRWFTGTLRQAASSKRKKSHVCKSPACYTLGLGVLPPTCATTNILVRGAQCSTSPTFASQTFQHAALYSISRGNGRQSAVKVGHGVLAISVAAGTGADVMASGAGAAGPAPDVRHPPPGYPDLLQYNTGYAGLSRDIQTYPQNKVIPGYPELSRDNPTWCLSRDNP